MSQPHGLIRNGAALVVTSNLTAGLGYLFWTACTRTLSDTTVGLAATVVSAILLVAVLAAGGLVPLLIRLLPRADAQEFSALCTGAAVVGTVLSVVGGALSCLFLPPSAGEAIGFGPLVAIMVVGSAGSALLLLAGAALVGARRADLSLVANVTASVVRLVGVVALLVGGAFTVLRGSGDVVLVLGIWLVSFVVAVLVALRLLARACPGLHWRLRRSSLVTLGRTLGWEHVTTLAAQLPPFVLPVLAAYRLSPGEVGYLYMASSVASAFFSVASAMSTALLAESSAHGRDLHVGVRRSLLIPAAVLAVPAAATCLFASHVMSLFGPEYGRHAGSVLALLVVASYPDIVTTVAVTVLRLKHELSRAAGLNVLMAVIYVGGTWVTLPRLGIVGAGWAQLAAQLVGTALVAWAVLARRARRSRALPGARHAAPGASHGARGARHASLHRGSAALRGGDAAPGGVDAPVGGNSAALVAESPTVPDVAGGTATAGAGRARSAADG